MRFHNALPAGTTATDLVLTLTELLRRHGVVNKFVEFCGSGLSSMSVPDRATLSNMSPEFGATASLFPVDDRTLEYLRGSGRDPEHIDLVERYTKEQGMFRTDASEIPIFSEMVELDLASVVPSVAGPKRPQDRVALPDVWKSFTNVWEERPPRRRVTSPRRARCPGSSRRAASTPAATASPQRRTDRGMRTWCATDRS